MAGVLFMIQGATHLAARFVYFTFFSEVATALLVLR